MGLDYEELHYVAQLVENGRLGGGTARPHAASSEELPLPGLAALYAQEEPPHHAACFQDMRRCHGSASKIKSKVASKRPLISRRSTRRWGVPAKDDVYSFRDRHTASDVLLEMWTVFQGLFKVCAVLNFMVYYLTAASDSQKEDQHVEATVP